MTPHSVVTHREPLLVWYTWTGNIKGAYWFCEHRSTARPNELVKEAANEASDLVEADGVPAESDGAYSNLKHASLSNPEAYYDSMADDYEATVRSWGYKMPELTAAKARAHACWPLGHTPVGHWVTRLVATDGRLTPPSRWDCWLVTACSTPHDRGWLGVPGARAAPEPLRRAGGDAGAEGARPGLR